MLFFFQSVYINIVFRHSRVANSAARNGIGPKFELIETSMDVLITCKNEEYQNKIESARVLTIFLPVSQGQLTQHSPSNKAKFRTHLRFMVTRVKKEAICCRHMATRVLILFSPQPNAAFPISIGPFVLEIFIFESGWMQGQSPARVHFIVSKVSK